MPIYLKKSSITLKPKRLKGIVKAPADKSISHRAIIIGALAKGNTHIKNLSTCDDCLRTVNAFRNMGVSITKNKNLVCIQGKGLDGLGKPKGKLYMGNSGTSLRLILGVLAGQSFRCILTADASLSQRPMKRAILPLSLMGAKISGEKKNDNVYAPLTIQGGRLRPIHYPLPQASAQVKSAILLAGLYAEGKTQITEPAKSRDHTERMLRRFGVDISVNGLSVSVQGRANLIAQDIEVPGDISSASFFLVGASICPGSQVTVKSVGLNPTRTAFLDILQKMGAEISWRIQNKKMTQEDDGEEERGEITARFSPLRALKIVPEQITSLIDELPILMVAATQAEGETTIQGAQELRVKETDRIKAMVNNLAKMGAEIKSIDDDVIIRGPSRLTGSTVDSFHDHRIAMSMAIAALVASGETTIKNINCVDISFPGFLTTLSQLI